MEGRRKDSRVEGRERALEWKGMRGLKMERREEDKEWKARVEEDGDLRVVVESGRG